MTDLLLEKQWEDWQKDNPASTVQHIDTEELKSRLINELTYVSQMSVEEYMKHPKYTMDSRHEAIRRKVMNATRIFDHRVKAFIRDILMDNNLAF